MRVAKNFLYFWNLCKSWICERLDFLNLDVGVDIRIDCETMTHGNGSSQLIEVFRLNLKEVILIPV